MITKQKSCLVCSRKYGRSPSEAGPAICTLCRHKPEAKAIYYKLAGKHVYCKAHSKGHDGEYFVIGPDCEDCQAPARSV